MEREGCREGFLSHSMAATINDRTGRTCCGSGKTWEEQKLCSSMLEIPLLKQDKNSFKYITIVSETPCLSLKINYK